jgi:hypothetical protein
MKYVRSFSSDNTPHLTAPNKREYEPYNKPTFVDDKTKTPSKKKFFKNKVVKSDNYGNPSERYKYIGRKCEKCGNIMAIANDECDFCGHINTTRVLVKTI